MCGVVALFIFAVGLCAAMDRADAIEAREIDAGLDKAFPRRGRR
jgi:hypothetical protein